ncbi:flagellar protein FliT [Halomonas salifodinae]|uniref:flagellar protein FliT n=1 Tax=Halomonas salifodinae TaxID=438745 RepID=UPI0033A9F307
MTQHPESGEAERLLACYEALLERSTRMLAKAREEAWEALIEEESHYVQEVERLAREDQGQALDTAQRERKADLLERILEQDMEVRRHLVARRDELGELIGNSRRKRDLERAYRHPQSAVIEARKRFPEGTP